MSRPTHPRRSGFTLIEVLVVILILGILVGLLVPAIQGAVRTAREAAINAEINNMAGALAEFKNRYGEYPPSRVLLMENGFYNVASTATLDSSGTTWFTDTTNFPSSYQLGGQGSYPATGTDLTFGQLAERSVRYLRKFFPRAGFSTTAALFSSTATDPNFYHDFNGNGTLDANPILLQGHECLVFFLGGLPTHGSQSTGMTGFGKLPQNPFLPFNYTPPASSTALSLAHDPSFYTFRAERLVDDDSDGVPGYVDMGFGVNADARYYAYFSAYSSTSTTGGYDPNDVNFTVPGDTFASGTSMILNFTVPFTVGTGNVAGSLVPNPYTKGLSVAAASRPAIYHAPQTFQILSPGRDRLYGLGGQYDANPNGERLPIDTNTADYNTGTAASDLTQPARQRERDNLSSFAGRLD